MTQGMEGFHDIESEPVAAHLVGYRSWHLEYHATTGLEPAPVTVGRRDGAYASRPGYPIANGSLTGLTHRAYVWGDGVNEADCGRTTPTWAALRTAPPTQAAQQSWRDHLAAHENVPPPVQSCGCGFWAYSSTSATRLAVVGGLVGVIHGWGRMIAGPKGFRCQFARIVALSVTQPTSNDELLAARRAAVAGCYPSVQMFDDPDLMFDTYPATNLAALLGVEPDEAF